MTTHPPYPVAAPAPAGWYPDPHTRGQQRRYWNGHAWTAGTAPAAPPAPVVVRAPAVVERRPRKIVTRGVSGSEHMLHVILCLLTFGLWIPFYLARCLAGRHRQIIKY